MPQSPQAPDTVERTDRRGQARSAPAPHTMLVQNAPNGLLVSHLLCAARPVFVPNMPAAVAGPDELEPGDPGVLMMDLIQAVVAHVCPEGTPEQTVGSLL